VAERPSARHDGVRRATQGQDHVAVPGVSPSLACRIHSSARPDRQGSGHANLGGTPNNKTVRLRPQV